MKPQGAQRGEINKSI